MGNMTRAAATLGVRVLPDFVGHLLLFEFFRRALFAPSSLGPSALESATAIWWFEFLFLHSWVFLQLARSGIRVLWLTLPVYAFFAFGVGTGLDTPWLTAIFWWHLLASLWSGWTPRAPVEDGRGGMEATRRRMRSAKRAAVRSWGGYAGALGAYLLAIAIGGIVEHRSELPQDRIFALAGLVYFGLRATASLWWFTFGARVDVLRIWENMEEADRRANPDG